MGGNRQCNAGTYRVRAIWILVAGAVVSILGLFLAKNGWWPYRTGRGHIDPGDANTALLFIVTGMLLPAGGLFGLLAKTGEWKNTRSDKVYGWQGKLVTWFLVIFVLILNLTVIGALTFGNFEELVNGQLKGYRPCDQQLPARVSSVFVYWGWLLTIALGTTVLTPRDAD